MTEPTQSPAGAPSDQALDDRVRAAAEALVALAPSDKLDGLEAWVTNQLAQIDHRTESRMMSESDKPSGDAPKIPAIDSSKAKPGRIEDSGLHDIKALAHDTRKRISRRTTGQHVIDESLLSASHSGLRAVALPEPALVVSLPDVPTSMAEVHLASATSAPTATASDGASITPITARKRTGVWVGVGAAGLAAAAVIAVMVSGGGGSKRTEAPAAAQLAAGSGSSSGSQSAEQEAARVATGAAMEERAAAGSGMAQTVGAGSAAAAPPAAPADGRTTDAKLHPEDSAKKGAGSAADRGPGSPTGRGSATDPSATGTAKPGAKIDPKKNPIVKPPAGNPGEKSIEDLLNDASGGPAKPKDAPGGGAPTGDGPAKPEKTGLDTKDIKGGMSSVAGKAQGCFDQHGVAGHVKVRVVIAPSGSVSKVDATGEFGGTPTGACVAGVVKGASFPAWTGAPMTVNYAFTLQE